MYMMCMDVYGRPHVHDVYGGPHTCMEGHMYMMCMEDHIRVWRATCT